MTYIEHLHMFLERGQSPNYQHAMDYYIYRLVETIEESLEDLWWVDTRL